MASKYEDFIQHADETALSLTRSSQNWTAFLTTAARLYKYPYHEQLMIYSQRPDATACAEYDIWNKRMGRYIKRGSKGIMIAGTNGVRYVFDVSDTGERERSRPFKLWEYSNEHEQLVTAALNERYSINGSMLFDTVQSASRKLAEEYWSDNQNNIIDTIANSFLEGYDRYNIRYNFINAVSVSTTYSALSRCGADPDGYFEREDFLPVFDFNTAETISELGTAVSGINQQILREIERTVKIYERARLAERTDNHERTDLHEERGLLHSEPQLSRNEGDIRKLRDDESGLSERAQNGLVEQADASGEPDSASQRDRQDRERADRADDAGADESIGRDGRAEGERPDTMGGFDEFLQDTGGRNDPRRVGVQLSLFPTEDEQIKIIDEAESEMPFAFSISDTDFENLLRIGSNTSNARMRIVAEFSKDKGLKSNIEFLKSIYHGGYGIKGEIDDFSAWYAEDGAHVNRGTTARFSDNAQVYSWEEIANKITEMLDKSTFATNVEISEAPGFERKEIAEKLWNLYHDLSDEASEYGYLSPLRRDKFLGFPDERDDIANKLQDKSFRQAITTELTSLINDYETDKSLIRFKFHKPKELLESIKELDLPRTAYPMLHDNFPKTVSFITDDEINEALRGGSRVEGGRGRIYEYFTENHTQQERVRFLKDEYGIGGHSHALSGSGGSFENHGGKGIEFTKNGCTKIQLSWNNVAKRIAELVRDDRYFTPEAKRQFEEKKREKQFGGVYGEYISIKNAHPDDMVLFQVGDFFEIFGEDAVKAAELLDIHITTRAVANGERVKMCGIPSFRLEENIEKLRDRYDVTVSAIDAKTEQRGVYTLLSVDREAERAIDLGETEYGADGTRAFGGDDEERSNIGELLEKYKPSVIAEVTEDVSYRNACKNSDYENAAVQCNSAVRYAVLNSGNIELIRLYSDMSEFRNRLEQEVIDETYPQLNELLRPVTIEDINSAVQAWNGDAESKQRVNEYIAAHGRERGTASWLENEYGSGSLTVRAGTPAAEELSWTAVQRTLIRMVSEDTFLTDADRVNNTLSIDEHADYSQYMGREIEIADRRFVVDHINDLFGTVELRDITFQDNTGFPIFRSEKLEWLQYVMESRDIQEPDVPEDLNVPLEENGVSIEQLPMDAPMPEIGNFRITDDDLGAGGAKAKFRANMDAINLLKELEFEGRQATEDEQEILSRYVGWGSLADAFDESKNNWSNEFQELYAVLSPDEYKAAKASVLNAHYTSPTVIRAMYDAIENMGFVKGNILEPSMGVGNFFGLLPESMSQSNLYGVELDSLTGRIAKQLYPKADITIAGFETTDRRDFYDLAVGNVPFGQYQVSDKAYNRLGFPIHDYFIAKAIDQVRPGGVIAFVTSRYTMDKHSPEARRYFAHRAELLGAIRLPNTAFKANAGTEVVSDILFFQKRESPIVIEPDWVYLGKNADGYAINSYFIEHPEMILGRQTSESTQYGKQDFTVMPYEGTDLAEQLKEAVTHIGGTYREAEIGDDIADEPPSDTLPADPNVKNYSYTVVGDEVYFRRNSVMTKSDANATALERIKGMVELRDCVHELIEMQMDADVPDNEIKKVQDRLNELYDSYVEKYGIINSRANSLAFSDDSSYYLLCSLENVDEDRQHASKADMFTKRTIKPHKVVTTVDTASEALALSISEKAKVDMEYMSQLTGKSEQDLFSELKGVIFLNTEHISENDGRDKYLTADAYLSGNVREKLALAEHSAELYPDDYSVNVEALKAAQPKDLDASEIEVRLGATWIDKEYIKEFMWETFEMPFYLRRTIEVNYSSYTAEWNITNKNSASYSDVNVYMTYGTERANAFKILEETLNLRDVRIYDTKIDADGVERRVLNSKETTLAQQKQQAIKDAFRDWIWRDPDRRQELVQRYNILFNSTRPREYDGSHITFSGMNPEIQLREHQLNAVAHILYGGNALLAHEVGAGKTFEMVAAAMESKRLGLCQKSLFVVPNHLTEQWASEFLHLYPSANILAATKKDFEPKNRKKFCARIATGDYDAIIIGHSQFERIPVSKERQERLIEEQIDELEQGLEELKNSRAERFTIKSVERTKRSLETRLKKLQDSDRKDDVVTFEQLGVDRLFVDEAHAYKNHSVKETFTCGKAVASPAA